MLSLEKDVARLEDDAHAALAQTPFQFIAAIQDWLAHDRGCGQSTIIRAIRNVVGKAGATGWTLFHSVVLLRCELKRSQAFATDFSG